MLAATRGCRDGFLSFGFLNAGLSSFADGSETVAEAPGLPTRRHAFACRPQGFPFGVHVGMFRELPSRVVNLSAELWGWCLGFFTDAFASSLPPRPPFDLLAEAKKGHVCLRPKKIDLGKSTLYPPHLQTIVDIDTSVRRVSVRNAKIQHAIPALAFTP